jgi:hypothetical protein
LKKDLLTLIIGMFIGAAAILVTPAYAAVKQYILTEVTYPIVVKGVEYKDPELPVLNYEGNTYVPLAKLGDITGLNYKWNATLKQVEIDPAQVATGKEPEPTPGGKTTSCDVAGQKGATLCPDTVIEKEIEPGYKGYPNSSDPSYKLAIATAADDLPPLLSEGWISDAMLRQIESIRFEGTNIPYVATLSTGPQWKTEVLATFQLSKEIADAKSGDFVINNIRIKKYDSNFFFNIDDLDKAGIISK